MCAARRVAAERQRRALMSLEVQPVQQNTLHCIAKPFDLSPATLAERIEGRTKDSETTRWRFEARCLPKLISF